MRDLSRLQSGYLTYVVASITGLYISDLQVVPIYQSESIVRGHLDVPGRQDSDPSLPS